MTTIERRLAALERKRDPASGVPMIFVVGVEPGDTNDGRPWQAKAFGQTFVQRDGEDEDSFRARVRVQVERIKPAGPNIPLVFLGRADPACAGHALQGTERSEPATPEWVRLSDSSYMPDRQCLLNNERPTLVKFASEYWRWK